MKIGAVIVNWNKKKLLKACLDSLLSQSRKPDDIVVVDNASQDGSQELVQNYPGVTLLQNAENLGGSGGFNRGMQYFLEKPDISALYLLDNDVFLKRETLETLEKRLLKGDVAIVGSKIFYYNQPQVIWSYGLTIDWEKLNVQHNLLGEKDSPQFQSEREVDVVAACSLLVKKDQVQKLGLWDDFFIYWDDTEWCIRFRRAGQKIVVIPDSIVYHHVAASFGDRTKPVLTYYGWRNRAVVFSRYGKKDVKQKLDDMFMLELHRAKAEKNTERFTMLLAAYHDWIFGFMGRRDF